MGKSGTAVWHGRSGPSVWVKHKKVAITSAIWRAQSREREEKGRKKKWV